MSSINFLESIDSGSNYKFGDKMEVARPKRSLFDLSHLVTTTLPQEGVVYPISIIPCLPGDDHDIYADCLLRVMPQVVPLYSRQRLYIYGFYSRWTDLFDKADIFITKGYSGNRDIKMPTLNSNNISAYYSTTSGSDYNNTVFGPDTLWDFMGLPQGVKRISDSSDITTAGTKTLSDDLINANINALPFMMYLRIWRDYFINKNHFINDRVILPDDDSRFRLNEAGELLSAKDASTTFRFAPNVKGPLNYNVNKTMGLFTHLYPSDYFTSALPFTQRGNATPLTGTLSDLTASTVSSIDFSDVLASGDSQIKTLLGLDTNSKLGELSTNTSGVVLGTNPISPYQFGYLGASGIPVSGTPLTASMEIAAAVPQVVHNTNALKNALNAAKITSTTTVNATGSLNIYAEDIRKLFCEQEELEKMARTDGSLGGFGLTFFGEKSRNAKDYKPTYIGGCYKNISFTEVLQTSGQSTRLEEGSEVNGSPLGSQAGHGIVGITNGRIGHVHCDDYGYIMLLACIMPDIYYHQGLDKHWSLRSQDEIYLPERARLGMQPILNKELYFAGNNGSSSGEDNYLWAYQNPFDDYRYKQNRICGKIADPNSASFFPYTQARHFNSLKNWGFNFCEAQDIRSDYLFAPNEDHFTAQFQFNIRSVRPLPYKAIPAKLI